MSDVFKDTQGCILQQDFNSIYNEDFLYFSKTWNSMPNVNNDGIAPAIFGAINFCPSGSVRK